jgi:hypothetical protein
VKACLYPFIHFDLIMTTMYEPAEMTEKQYQRLVRDYAYFAGLEELSRWGDATATKRWVLDHGYSEELAEAEAMEVVLHWGERQLSA